VPVAIAKVFFALANERRFRAATEGIVLERARDYAPKPSDPDYKRRRIDVPWLDRFGAAGGRAIKSGDVRMRERPHEILALYQHGFVVIFFERGTGGWDFFHKSALLLHWWKQVVAKIRTADRGTFWVVPSAWPLKDKELRNESLGLAKLLKDGDTAPPADKARTSGHMPPQLHVEPTILGPSSPTQRFPEFARETRSPCHVVPRNWR
jgi:hypothetical protein